MGKEGTRSVRSWWWLAAAAAYNLLVYALVPVARRVWAVIEPLLGRDVGASIAIIGGLVALTLAVRAWLASPVRQVAGPAVLLACFAAYAALLVFVYAGRVTVEKVHLLEYGVLGYLVMNALDNGLAARRGPPLAAAWLLAAGIGDELIQAVSPDRFFDLLDIAGNWLGAALGVVAWAGASRNSPWRRNER